MIPFTTKVDGARTLLSCRGIPVDEEPGSPIAPLDDLAWIEAFLATLR